MFGAGADPDCGDVEAVGDFRREVRGDGFHQHDARAGFGKGDGVVEDDLGGFLGFALAFETAELAHVLGRQADMAADRDGSFGEEGDGFDHRQRRLRV